MGGSEGICLGVGAGGGGWGGAHRLLWSTGWPGQTGSEQSHQCPSPAPLKPSPPPALPHSLPPSPCCCRTCRARSARRCRAMWGTAWRRRGASSCSPSPAGSALPVDNDDSSDDRTQWCMRSGLHSAVQAHTLSEITHAFCNQIRFFYMFCSACDITNKLQLPAGRSRYPSLTTGPLISIAATQHS